MDNTFGADYVTLTDEDGKEYEFEVLHTTEYQGQTYYALCPADDNEGDELDVIVMRLEIGEDGEEELVVVDDEDEEEAVYEQMLFETEDEEEDE